MELRTREEIIAVLKDAAPIGNPTSTPWGESLPGHRDINRLLPYLTYNEAKDIFGDIFDKQNWLITKLWSEKTIMEDIRSSLKFAFEKALDQRGISSWLMHGVMRMWMWVIQDEELTRGDPGYSDYGVVYCTESETGTFPK